MPKPYPIELRQRVVDHVDKGHSHRSTAGHFEVSVKFVNDMIKLRATTGNILPCIIGNNRGHGKLAPYKDWIITYVKKNKDVTLYDLRSLLKSHFDLEVHHVSICRFLHRLGWSHKKKRFMPKNKGA